jgi:CheY-like chemotaxis protein
MDTKTILIVDDEEPVLYVLKNSLMKLGHEFRILTALDAATALKYMEKYQVDLLITDYHLQGMNGLELLETVHNVQPNTRVIFITAYGSEKVEAEANRLNTFAYLNKPLDLATFREVVKQAIGNISIRRPGVVVQTVDIKEQISGILTKFQKSVNATCALLVNLHENTPISVGDTQNFSENQTLSLVQTAQAILEKSGSQIDGETGHSVLQYRESRDFILITSSVNGKHIFVALIPTVSMLENRGQLFERATQTVNELNEAIFSTENSNKERVFDTGFNKAVLGELDKLFASDEEEGNNGSLFTLSDQQKQDAMNAFTMSPDEALAVGLILPSDDTDDNNKE